jgi:zinc protease
MNHSLRSQFAIALALVFALTSTQLRAADADKSAGPKKVTSIEGVTEYRLDNGLRVLLFPDPSSSRVTVNLTVLVGSRHEGYGETGMAHLLEHMLFKGTPLHPAVPKALVDHGADKNFNGTTWVDRTNYFESMPAKDENLEFAIRLEADRMVNSYVKREDLLSEMTVVRNEFERGENDPERILSQRMTAAAYEWHNYGKSTIGNRTDIERVPIDRLQAFYKKYYRPDNAVVVVAGKFEDKKALDYITKYFGPVKNPKAQLDATYTEEPAQDGEREVQLRRVGKIGVVGSMYHICAGSHDDFAAVEILEDILTSAPSGRLYKALVESKKASRVNGSAFAFHDPGVLEISAAVEKDKSLTDVRTTMIDVLEKLADQPVTDEEVARSKKKILADRERLMTNVNRIGVVLTEWAAAGDWRLFFLHRDRVEKVTPADVQRVAKKYLVRSNRTVGVFVPMDKAEYAAVPENPDLDKLLKDYKGRAALASGEAFDPTPLNIEKRVQRSQLGDGKGVKLALFPKKTRGSSVIVSLALHYGNEKSLSGHTSATQFIGPLMMRGTKKKDRQKLQDALDNLGAQMSVSGLIGNLDVSIECKRDKLPEVLDLLEEVLRQPAFPASEFDVLKRQLKARMEKMLPEPQFRADRELRRRLSPYPPEDVRYTPTIEESISRLDAVTIDEIRKIYEEQIGGDTGELAVVGDFDPAEVAKRFGKILGDWKAKDAYTYIPRPADTRVEGTKVVIDTPDKANAVYIAGHSVAMKDSDADYPALTIGNFLFGGGSLSSRLGDRVRQKEGLSYGVGARYNADSRDPSARLFIFAITNPKNIDKVNKAIAEEFDKLLKEGISEAELKRAKEAYLEAQQNERGKDANIAGMLAGGLFDGRTLQFDADFEKKIAALTVEEVNQALRKHWSPKKLVIIHGGDFKKKSE